ncbi:MAG: hypothetical protein E5X51_03820 [Mesorhizobium sp.]|uniref:hypothetical protein n=1 Tax=Mesorhizobium sp. TaxID=1871066 RepID=UPI0012185558|nr:hypothetical protein [Mesorhizobium sp.]TIQ22805.1 MAG: hypothetical protein E5X51_03820 [Mesorhizobium sp.]
MDIGELRQLCAEYWNPIGVPMSNSKQQNSAFHRPLPEDEYDTYLVELLRMMKEGKSKYEILSYIDYVEKEYIMMESGKEKKNKFIDKLFSAWNNR